MSANRSAVWQWIVNSVRDERHAVRNPTGAESVVTAPDWRIAVALFSMGVCIEALIAHRLSNLGAFEQNSVLFDADIKLAFTEAGKATHPFLGYLFSVPLRILAAAASSAGLIADQVVFREAVALFISPFMFGLKTAVDFIVFRMLQLGRARAMVGALCGAAAFSSVVFGAIPDSYAASGCALSILTLLAVQHSREPRRPSWTKAWLAAATLAVGITISNVIQVGAMALARLRFWSDPKVRTVIAAMTSAAGVLLAVVFVGSLLRLAHGNESRFELLVQRYTPSRIEQLTHLARFPEILGRSFIATTPEESPASRPGDPPVSFTYNGRPFDAASGVLWLFGAAVMAGGIMSASRMQGVGKDVTLSATLAVLTFGLVYSLFGRNTFLYSQYWQAPATLLIAGWLLPPDDRMRIRATIATAFLVVMLVRDWLVMTGLEHRIAVVLAATAPQ